MDPPIPAPCAAAPAATTAGRRKLTFNEQRELTALPGRIEALESEKAALETTMASPEFYKESADAIARTMARLPEVEEELTAAYQRWDELDSRT